MMRGRFDNMSVAHAAIEAYGDEEGSEFMAHFHRGSIAKAVLGDENEFVHPQDLDAEQTSRMLTYLSGVALQRKMTAA